MVQLQELRKCNILEVDGQYIKVSHFDNDAIYEEDEFNDVGAFDIQECDGVLIIPEILDWFVFFKKAKEKWNDTDHWFIGVHGYCIAFDGNDWYLKLDIDSERIVCFFRYLHQLQNLYFSLTGQELKINI